MISFANKKQQLGKLYYFVGPKARNWMLLGVGGTVILTIVELSIAYFVPLFLNSLGLIDSSIAAKTPFGGERISVWVVSCGLLGLGVIRFVGQYLVNHAGIAAQEIINARLRKVLIYQMLLEPKQAFIAAAQSNYLLGSIFASAALAVLLITVSAAQSLQSFSLIVVMLSISWKEALLSIFGLGLVGLFVRRINHVIARRAAFVPVENKKLVSGIERVARNWLLIRILKTQTLEHRKFSRSIEAVQTHSLKAASYSDIAGAGTPLLGVILLTLIVFISSSYLATPGSVLISFLYIFIRFVQGLSATVASATQTSRYFPQLKEAMRYFFEFQNDQLHVAFREEGATATDGTQSLALLERMPAPTVMVESATFRYDQRDIIRNLSLRIPAGETFGIIGPSGSGKSTLLLLLLGVLRPQKGQILIDDHAAADILMKNALQIGYVGPEPFLFEGTIRENLAYGLAEPSTEELWAALAASTLKEAVASLHDGLEHRLSENGDGLSAGQKQRLCLARIFLRKPSLIILDEATANLDARTELEVVDSLALLKGHATIIIVTHRMTALKHADAVFDMERQDLVTAELKRNPAQPMFVDRMGLAAEGPTI